MTWRPKPRAERLRRLDALLAEAGRSRADVQVFVGPNRHPVTAASLAAYAAAGVDQVIAPLAARSIDKLKARMDALLQSADAKTGIALDCAGGIRCRTLSRLTNAPNAVECAAPLPAPEHDG